MKSFVIFSTVLAVGLMGTFYGCEMASKTKTINISQGNHDGFYQWDYLDPNDPMYYVLYDSEVQLNSGGYLTGGGPFQQYRYEPYLIYQLGIPANKTITSAKLRYVAANNNIRAGPQVRIKYATQIDVSPPAITQDVKGWTLSSDYVAWTLPIQTVGEVVESPDLSTLIQGVMQLPGYKKTSRIALRIEFYSLTYIANSTQFESFEANGTGPQLIIEYSPAITPIKKHYGRKFQTPDQDPFEAMTIRPEIRLLPATVQVTTPPRVKAKVKTLDLEDKFSDFPESLKNLLFQLAREISRFTGMFQAGEIGVDLWYNELQRLIIRYHLAAYMTGQDEPLIGETDKGIVWEYIKAQIEFLDNFRVQVVSANQFKKGWESRARMYATSIVAPYWKGRTKILPLPAMPGDMSTPCGQLCACGWDIKTLKEKTDDHGGDYDCYWLLNQFRVVETEHCQACVERSEQWAPLKIRDGRIEIPEAYLKQFHFDEYHGETSSEARRIVEKVIHDLDFLASLKHLPGQHDQKTHGSWAAGRSPLELSPSEPGPERNEQSSYYEHYKNDFGVRSGIVRFMRQNYPTFAEYSQDITQLDLVIEDFRKGFNDGSRSEWKAKVSQQLSEDTGMSEFVCSDVLQQWAGSSNDDNLGALEMQAAAAELFGVPMSDWQRERLANLRTKRAQESVTNAEIEELLRPGSYTAETIRNWHDKYRNYEGETRLISEAFDIKVPVDAEPYKEYQKAREKYYKLANDERLSGGARQWLNTTNTARFVPYLAFNLKSNPFEESTGERKIGSRPDKYKTIQDAYKAVLKAMYARTQEEFKSKGIARVLLSRGIALPAKTIRKMKLKVNDVVDISLNALESWAVHPGVAADFAGLQSRGSKLREIVIQAWVPVERILCSPYTGLGCLGEFEYIVINHPNDSPRVIFIGEGDKAFEAVYDVPITP